MGWEEDFSEIWNLKQEGTVRQYIAKFEYGLRRVPPATEDFFINVFLRGLSQEITRRIDLRRVDSLEELMNQAIRVAKTRAREEREKQNEERWKRLLETWGTKWRFGENQNDMEDTEIAVKKDVSSVNLTKKTEEEYGSGCDIMFGSDSRSTNRSTWTLDLGYGSKAGHDSVLGSKSIPKGWEFGQNPSKLDLVTRLEKVDNSDLMEDISEQQQLPGKISASGESSKTENHYRNNHYHSIDGESSGGKVVEIVNKTQKVSTYFFSLLPPFSTPREPNLLQIDSAPAVSLFRLSIDDIDDTKPIEASVEAFAVGMSNEEVYFVGFELYVKWIMGIAQVEHARVERVLVIHIFDPGEGIFYETCLKLVEQINKSITNWKRKKKELVIYFAKGSYLVTGVGAYEVMVAKLDDMHFQKMLVCVQDPEKQLITNVERGLFGEANGLNLVVIDGVMFQCAGIREKLEEPQVLIFDPGGSMLSSGKENAWNLMTRTVCGYYPLTIGNGKTEVGLEGVGEIWFSRNKNLKFGDLGYIGSVEGQVGFEGMAVDQGKDKVLVRFGFESKEDGLVSISFEGIGKEIKVSFGDQVEKLDESEGGGEVDGGNGSKEEQLRGVSIEIRTEVHSAGEKEKKLVTWWKVPLKVLKSCVWKVGHGWTFTVACKLSLPAEAIQGVSRLIHGGYEGLVKWKGPPAIENTGEPYEPIVLPFRTFTLRTR